jgi:glycosyltransferase involved in cell wall biosynthesis
VKISHSPIKRIKLGIVANEFFGREVGGAGGFGWAARQVANLFNQHPEHGVDVVFLNRTLQRDEAAVESLVHDTRMIARDATWLSDLQRLRAERFDLLLMIDYRPSYRFFAAALPQTSIVVWVRDPRTAADMREINTLRIPGAEAELPQGIAEVDSRSLSKIVRGSRLFGRRVLFATPAPGLSAKVPATYGVRPSEVFFLPNIIDLNLADVSKSARPSVVFLGRLDPIKRPWLFVKLAEQFPDVDFVFMGQSHFRGAGAWAPVDLPANLRLLGHVGEEEKSKLLASSWTLVNTSIHEALAVSFLEALACETPIISCQNPEEVVSRFGVYVGRWDGTGLEALPLFVEALKKLLSDTALRLKLGKEGRAWVAETHTLKRFLHAFRDLCATVGVGQSPG